jgi:hypothetical protein
LLLTMLTACSSKPPKYNGESAKAYGEKLGEYYGQKSKKISNLQRVFLTKIIMVWKKLKREY